jgi:hypothetical protein
MMRWAVLIVAYSAVLVGQRVVFQNPNDPSLDTTGPVVTITTPTSSTTYDNGSDATLTTLAGTSTGGTAICRWSNDQGGSGTATTSADGSWTVSSISIAEGDNVLTGTCVDPGNNQGADTLTVSRDAEASSTLCTDAGSNARYLRQGASGANNGTNWTDAWSSAATAETNLTRGQTLCVADSTTDYGSVTFNTAKSGTTLITWVKATVADHGTSTGWVDTYGDGQAVFDGWTFDNTGYFLMHGAGRSSISAGHGFRLGTSGTCVGDHIVMGSGGSGGSDHLTFAYVEVAGEGYIDNPTCNDRSFYANGGADAVNNITVQYCHMHGMFVPFLTRQTNTLTVEYCYIHDNNSTPANHAETWSDAGTDDVIFRYNVIKNPEGSASVFIGNGGASGSPTDSNTSSNWHFYGNVWYQDGYSVGAGHNSGLAGVIYCANDASNRNYCDGWLFFNNTIANLDTGTAGSRLFFENITGVTGPIARNNLFYSNGSNASHSNVTLTHNWYHSTTHTSDSSDEQSGSGDPFVSLAGEDFHLTAGTTAGSTTSQPAGNTVDPDGVTRSTPDRGAYEFP